MNGEANSDLKKRLSEIEYNVTQNKDTEKPFSGKYWKFFDDGYYHCIVCDSALFKSEDKYYTSCGWPSFKYASYPDTIDYTEDLSHGMKRVEITCKKCGAHLGHVFEDGPEDTKTRYCVNSASLKFYKK